MKNKSHANNASVSMTASLQLPLRRQSFTPTPPKSEKLSSSKIPNPRKNRYLKQSVVNKLGTFEKQETSRSQQLHKNIEKLRNSDRKAHILKEVSSQVLQSDVQNVLQSEYKKCTPPTNFGHKTRLLGYHAHNARQERAVFVEQNKDSYMLTPQEKVQRGLKKIRFIQRGLKAIQDSKYDGLNSYVNQLDNFKSVKQQIGATKLNHKLIAMALQNGELTFDQRRHIIDNRLISSPKQDDNKKTKKTKQKHNHGQQNLLPTVNQILERAKKSMEKKQSCVECGSTMNPALRARAFVNRIKLWSKLYDTKFYKQANFLNYNEKDKHLFKDSLRLNAAEISKILLKEEKTTSKINTNNKKTKQNDCDPLTNSDKEEHKRMKEMLLKSAKIYAKDIVKQHKYMTSDETVTALANIKLISKKANKNALKTLKYLNDASAHNDLLQCQHRKHIDRTCKVVAKNQQSLQKHLQSLLDETNGLLHKNKPTTKASSNSDHQTIEDSDAKSESESENENETDMKSLDDKHDIVIDSESMLGHFNRLQDNQAKISEETETILQELDDLILHSKTHNDNSIRKLKKTLREFKKLKKERKGARRLSVSAQSQRDYIKHDKKAANMTNDQSHQLNVNYKTDDAIALENMNLTVELNKKDDIIYAALKEMEALRFRRYNDEQLGVDYILNRIENILTEKEDTDEATLTDDANELQTQSDDLDEKESENMTMHQATQLWHNRVKTAGVKLQQSEHRNKELEKLLQQAMKRIAIFEQEKYIETKYIIDTKIESQ